MNKRLLLSAAVILCVGLVTRAHGEAAEGRDALEAFEGPPPARDFGERQGLGIGMAVAYSNEPYRGVGSETRPFPILLYRGKRFAAFGPFMSYELFGLGRPWGVKAVLGPAFDGYDADDSNFLEGMEDRDMTAEGGLEVEYDTPLAAVSLGLKHDLLGEHDGYQVDLTVRKPLFLGRVLVSPSLSYNYASEDRSDYYFGVRPSEATAARPAYELDGTHNLEAGVLATTQLGRRFFTLAGAGYTLYDEDIQDSPIVSKDGKFRIFLGFGYRFGGGRPETTEETVTAFMNP